MRKFVFSLFAVFLLCSSAFAVSSDSKLGVFTGYNAGFPVWLDTIYNYSPTSLDYIFNLSSVFANSIPVTKGTIEYDGLQYGIDFRFTSIEIINNLRSEGSISKYDRVAQGLTFVLLVPPTFTTVYPNFASDFFDATGYQLFTVGHYDTPLGVRYTVLLPCFTGARTSYPDYEPDFGGIVYSPFTSADDNIISVCDSLNSILDDLTQFSDDTGTQMRTIIQYLLSMDSDSAAMLDHLEYIHQVLTQISGSITGINNMMLQLVSSGTATSEAVDSILDAIDKKLYKELGVIASNSDLTYGLLATELSGLTESLRSFHDFLDSIDYRLYNINSLLDSSLTLLRWMQRNWPDGDLNVFNEWTAEVGESSFSFMQIFSSIFDAISRLFSTLFGWFVRPILDFASLVPQYIASAFSVFDSVKGGGDLW